MSSNPKPCAAVAMLPDVEARLYSDPAWEHARNTYLEGKAKVKGKDLELISDSDGPADLARFLEKVEENKGLYAGTVELIRTCCFALKERESGINTLASVGGPPGNLAWGTIKLVLFMVRGYTEEFVPLLKLLNEICSLLKPIQVEVETFKDSKVVQDSLVGLYLSIIKFWEKAMIAHTTNEKKRHRLYHIGHALWKDLESDVTGLKADIEKQIRIFLVATGAAHHRDTKEKTTAIQDEFTKAARISRQKAISTWLGPPIDAPYGNDFYEDDLSKLLKDRHPGTCRWIFQTLEFSNWKHDLFQDDQRQRGPALWIAAGPGAGKSILAASIIEHLQNSSPADCDSLLYYFIIGTDKNKSPVLSIMKSILFQMYVVGQRSETRAFLDFEVKLENAATNNLRSADLLWKMVAEASGFLKAFYLIIDAVDECDDYVQLLSKLEELRGRNARLLITGRPAELMEHCNKIAGLQRLDVQLTHVLPDMKLFLDSKIKGAFHPSQHSSTVNKVLLNANGMFLWVSLVSQELETAGTVEEIQRGLETIPGNLYDAYDLRLQRMIRSMSSSSARLKRCHRVLQWLCSSRRALRPLEVFDAMAFSLSQNNVLFSVESLLRDCGAFVTEVNGILSLRHFTAREYLLSKHLAEHQNRDLAGLWVNLSTANFTLLQACINCLLSPKITRFVFYDINTTSGRSHLSTPSPETALIDPRAVGFNTNEYSSYSEQASYDAYIDMLTKTRRMRIRREIPFLEYAATFWLSHLHSIPILAGEARHYVFVQPLINSHLTLSWIELFLTFNSGKPGILMLQRELSTDFLRVPAKSPDTTQLMSDITTWKAQILSVTRPMIVIMTNRPEEVRFLDSRSFQQYVGPELKRRWETHLAEKILVRDDYNGPDSWKSPRAEESLYARSRYLWGVSPEGSTKIVFFCYHSTTKTFIYATEHDGLGAGSLLFCQDSKTGQPLPPFAVFRPQEGERTLVEGSITGDGRHIGLQYVNQRGFADFVLLDVRNDRRQHAQHHFGWISKRCSLHENISNRDGPAGKLFCFSESNQFLTRQHALDLRTGAHSYRNSVGGEAPPNAAQPPGSSQTVRDFVMKDGSILQQVRREDVDFLLHTPPTPGKTATHRQLEREAVAVIAASPDGNYAALRAFKVNNQEARIVLLRVADGRKAVLRLPLLPKHEPSQTLFAFFLEAPARLVAAFEQKQWVSETKASICVWEIAEVEAGNLAARAGARSINASISTVHVHGAANEIYLVSRTRSWMRFGLETMEWLDSTSGLIQKEENDTDSSEKGYMAARFSHDKRHLALVSVISDVIKIDLMDTRSCLLKCRYELDIKKVTEDENEEETKKEDQGGGSSRPWTRDLKRLDVHHSPSLQMMWIYCAIFYLYKSGSEAGLLPFDLPDSLSTTSFSGYTGRHALSACSKYVAIYVEPKRVHPRNRPAAKHQNQARGDDSGGHKVHLYRTGLDTEEGLGEELNAPELRALDADDVVRIAFHPSECKLFIVVFSTDATDAADVDSSTWKLHSLDMDGLDMDGLDMDGLDMDGLDMDGLSLTEISSGTLDFAVSDDWLSHAVSLSDPVFSEDSISVYYSEKQNRSRIILHGYLTTAPGPDHQVRRLRPPDGYCGSQSFTSELLQEIFHFEYHISMLGPSEINLRNYEVSLEIRTNNGQGWDFYGPLCWRTPREAPDEYYSRWTFSSSRTADDDHNYSMSKYFLTSVPAHLIDKCDIFVLVWADEGDNKPARFRVMFVDRWTGHVEVKTLHLTWEQFIWDLDDYFHPPDEAHRKYQGYIPRGVGRRSTTVAVR